MSTGTGKAPVPGGQTTGSPAEGLHRDYTGGAGHAIQPIQVSSTTQKTFQGGEHLSMAVTAGSLYKIDSDIDLYYKTSSVAADVGLIGLTDAIGLEVKRTNGSLATMTGLEFGTGDFAFEGWLKISGRPAASSRSCFLFGRQGQTLMPYIQMSFTESISGGLMNWGCLLYSDSASTTALINGSTDVAGVSVGEIMHVIVNVVREGAASDVICTPWFNGAQSPSLTGSGTDDAGEINASDSTDGASKLMIGTTWAEDPSWIGDIYNLRFYNRVLTAGEIATRNAAGPSDNVVDAASVSALTWETNFQNFGDWNDADEVETSNSLGNAIFTGPTALIGTVSDYVGVQTGGELALPSDSPRNWAGVGNDPILIPTGDTFLNLYSKPGASGTANISLLG